MTTTTAMTIFLIFLSSPFSSDPYILTFAQLYCYVSRGERRHRDTVATVLASKFATSALRDCLAADRPEALPAYLWLYRLVRGAVKELDPTAMWNVRLIEAVICGDGSGDESDGMAAETSTSNPLLDRLFLETSLAKMDMFFSWLSSDSAEGPVFAETVGSVGDLLLAPSIERGFHMPDKTKVENIRRWLIGLEATAPDGAELSTLLANRDAKRLAASSIIFSLYKN